ncbi:sensor histidine kinase [Paraflavisolibacter sp. H34]|uniref:sensor histidine kinase n=1 Tax=Huijunlia imazamoxiresistens TaxID=3127457 RepID=UPI003018CB79
MNESAGIKYGLRLALLYLLSIVFKSFDLTFPKGIGVVLLRGQLFSLLFVAFGLAAWVVAERFSKKLEHRLRNKPVPYRVLLLCSILVLYGALVAYIFSFCYAAFDILLFRRYEAWASFTSFSYDLIAGFFLFYMLLLGYNGIIFYYKNWREAQLNAERLMRENIQAKYDLLKSQIEPHFFFNSLSVLTQLVYKSPELSSEYITQLAKTYRYILDKKFENLVFVQTELEFLESYLFLICIRHEGCIVFDLRIDEQVKTRGLVPPATLQMLVENAVKHNRFSTDKPLHISIKSEGGALYVANDLRRRSHSDSTGVGLDNIIKRYELASDRRIEITELPDTFIVKLPIIYGHERNGV